MNKTIWDLYAPVYEVAMSADQKIYQFMYRRIEKMVRGKDVLEIATGPGLLARHVAHAAHKIIASDYSAGMIIQAKKRPHPENLVFEVADAHSLPYKDNSFDVVIISNALHVVSKPERVLAEIDRVLKKGGLLIAPNFVEHQGGILNRIWSSLLKYGGIHFEHQWTREDYLSFLKRNGWHILRHKLLRARIPMVYTECTKITSDYPG